MYLAKQNQTIETEVKQQLTSRYAQDMKDLQNANTTLQTALDAKEKALRKSEDSVAAAGTQIFNDESYSWIAYRERKEQQKALKIEYDALKKTNEQAITDNNKKLIALQGKMEKELNNLAQTSKFSDGIFARSNALYHIIYSESSSLKLYAVLMAAIVALEISAMLLKITSSGEYEAELRQMAEEQRITRENKLSEIIETSKCFKDEAIKEATQIAKLQAANNIKSNEALLTLEFEELSAIIQIVKSAQKKDLDGDRAVIVNAIAFNLKERALRNVACAFSSGNGKSSFNNGRSAN